MERVEQILKHFKNNFPINDIYLLWSGGIDTTAVVVGFLKAVELNLISKDKIIIAYCERSKEEYP